MDNLLRLIGVLGTKILTALTIRQLAKEAGVPYATAYRTISKHQNLFAILRKGNLKLCSLQLKDPLIKHYLIIAERQRTEEFLKKCPPLNILRKELPEGGYACVLFGSRAEGKYRQQSDVDLCIINGDGSKTVTFSKYELVFKLEINPIYLSEEEFGQMLGESVWNLAHEIVGKHIILYGEEYFWDILFPWASKAYSLPGLVI